MNHLNIRSGLHRIEFSSTSTRAYSRWRSLGRSLFSRVFLIGGVTAVGISYLASPVFASGLQAHCPSLPWCHKGPLSSFDHASVRRGYQVYKEVCAACHSMQYVTYRHLIKAVLTEQEAKVDASGILVVDGPNDDGKMFERPGRLTDTLPSPYANPEEARAANNGAAPPDLTFIVKARHGAEDYVFHLLTGYCDPPHGRNVADGQYYNPYFPGGAISMARALYDDMLEYDDGTRATTSQMAKDVVSFLCWTADMNHDQRKRVSFKAAIVVAIGFLIVGMMKKKRWSSLKSRKMLYKNRPLPKDV